MRARDLRKAMTEPEVWLWARLKRLRARGYHFRRQSPFRGYYLDFVCFRHRLVVELDGGQHADDRRADHDAVRDAILGRCGFQVLRFWNSAVRSNIDGVMDTIIAAAASGPLHRSGANPDFPTRPALRAVHPPHEGEG